ncbi:hypothetical protein ACFDR9_001355 [Janthinobacterium sp. CG_23.3]|uniref:hypothetical protein n=1 Tax=Janthinobacterium sp. CG_23.3 TaxID=3349634 RepID=UPI0038D3B9C2
MSKKIQATAVFHTSAVLLTCLLGAFSSVASSAQAPGESVSMELEPNHKVKFDNGKVRMYEVNLPNGNATLMHEHREDNFLVVFKNVDITNDVLGAKPAAVSFPAGSVRFTSTAKGEYSHRVIVSGEKPLHLVAMELLSAAPATPAAAAPRRAAPFTLAMENSRARVYKLTLAPGESTESFIRPAGSALFAISAGRLREKTDKNPDRLWDFESGNFKWSETSEKVSLKNESAVPVDMVEIDVF